MTASSDPDPDAGSARQGRFHIRPARTRSDLRATGSLFQAYAASLGFSLTFQSFEAELAGLPGKYAPGRGGEILIARLGTMPGGEADQEEKEEEEEGTPVGCVALRSLSLSEGHDGQEQDQQHQTRRVDSVDGDGDGDGDVDVNDGEIRNGRREGARAEQPSPSPRHRVPRVCEMKRLYVDPRARGLGVGKALVEQILDVACTLGYDEIRLDTIPPQMAAAVALYEVHGFVDVAPYYPTPMLGTRFLGLDLRAWRARNGGEMRSRGRTGEAERERLRGSWEIVR